MQDSIDERHIPAGAKAIANKNGRFASIEFARIAAAFGIVWFHSRIGTSSFHNISYSGLVYFIIVTVFFQFSKINLSRKEFLESLNNIIYLSITWNIMYFCIKYYILKQPMRPSFQLILSGASLHLWYMPFLIITLILCYIGRRVSLGLARYVSLAGITVLTLTVDQWRGWSLSLDPPAPQYVHALFAVFAGVLLEAFFLRRIIYAALVVFGCAAALLTVDGVGLPYLIGCAVFTFAYALRERIALSPSVTALSECTFGIYLVHPMFFPIARFATGHESLLVPCVAFAVSAALVMSVRQYGGAAGKWAFGLPLRPRSVGRS